MNSKLSFLLICISLLCWVGCTEDFDLNAPVPSQEDAAFTFSPSAENENIINFSSSSSLFLMTWDLGNGSTGTGQQITGTYPTAGTYTVTLTVYNKGGSASSTREIVIDQTDPTLLDKPLYNMLTGGADATEGKTWVIDSASAGHFGVGPNPSVAGDFPEYYQAGPNEKSGGGMYDDRYTFYLENFGFDMQTNGDVYINGSQGPNFPGAVDPGVGDLRAPYTPPDGLTWSIAEPADDYPVLTISPGGFIGYYAGGRTYQIINIEENELFLRFVDQSDDALAWYVRLIPEGYDSSEPGGETPEVALPLDFETQEPVLGLFGGTSASFVDNPDATGVNTSSRVLEVIHGNETWAGFSIDLTENLDLASNSKLSVMVWSPVETDFLFKLEALDNPDNTTELSIPITTTNEWIQLTFDFSDQPNDFGRVVLFPGFGSTDAETFYVDNVDFAQAAPTSLTMDALTGGSQKAWVLKPAAGSFGVGPAKGSDEYYPNGGDLSTERPCLFNDQFIFKSTGDFEYDAQGDIFGEGYMGLSDGCQDETNLDGTPSESWGSGIHTFSLEDATADAPAYLTVSGTGAFIALPKAYNGGEYDAATPPMVDGSVTYEVLNYTNEGSEELALTIDITGDGSTFWNFVLVPAE